ncbi:MAG: sulfatase [Actinomycetota bacterium]|nr:sulfatase [Actinomycetota bacterium]
MKWRLLVAGGMLVMIPALWLVQWAITKNRPQERPNVLMFLTDDQPSQSMHVMPKTTGWFGQSSTRFTNSFVTTPLCCPARASIFTGRYSHNHGVASNFVAKQVTDLDQRTTFQHHLDRAGYRTALFGKYLNAWPLERRPPYFDEWAIFTHSATADYGQGEWNSDNKVGVVDGYSSDLMGERAERLIRGEILTRRITLIVCAAVLLGGAWGVLRKHAPIAVLALLVVVTASTVMGSITLASDRPWLLVLSTSAPHVPSVVRTADVKSPVPVIPKSPARGETDLSDKPSFIQEGATGDAWAHFVRRKQLRSLWSVDDLVDKVMRSLADTGDLSHTLAIFTSDNGLLWGDHGNVGKGFPYTSSIKVPLLVRWPDTLAMPGADDRMVNNLDLAPTILDVAGVPYASDVAMDGRSLVNASRERERVFFEYRKQRWAVARPCPEVGCIPGWKSLRTPTYQYTEYYQRGHVLSREYYDLEADPWQLQNLLADASRKNDPDVEELEAQLRDDMLCKGLDCP